MTQPKTIKHVASYAAVGFIIRAVLTNLPFGQTLSQRVEISTPVTSWKRAVEGVYLLENGLLPYSGDTFHESPLSLRFYQLIIGLFGPYVNYFVALIDVSTAIFLYYSSFNQLTSLKQNTDLEMQQFENLGVNKLEQDIRTKRLNKINCITDEQIKIRTDSILFLQLFSPLTLMACCGMPTSIFTNFLVSVIYSTFPHIHLRIYTCVLCACLSFHNIHYSTIILPTLLSIEYFKNTSKAEGKQGGLYYRTSGFKSSLYSSGTTCLSSLAILFVISFILNGKSIDFLQGTYLFALNIRDYTPNIGMFWYFYMEMFDHFLSFFIWVMQINAFIHVIPISIALRSNPLLALYITLFSSSLFQPFPSLSSFNLVMNLLPQWADLFPFMRRNLIVGSALVACVSLAPIFWHMWIMMYTANSNFYFGATLAFTTAQILLMAELLTAYGYSKALLGRLKRDAILSNRMKNLN